MTLTALVFCGITFTLYNPQAHSSPTTVNTEAMTELLDNLFHPHRYDPRLRPNYNGDPVEVTVGFWVISFERLDVVNMDFTIDIFLRQEWTDGRLDHGLNQTITLNRRILKKIWIPDSYFVNGKTGKLHRVTTPNMMVMIAPGGIIKYNVRATIKAACPVDLRSFPMDVQTCPLIMESYGYDNEHIQFKWELLGKDGMKFKPPGVRLMPNYDLTNIELSNSTTAYIVGNFSSIQADFTFERTYSYFLSHVYGTSSVIVVVSWLGFALRLDQTAARVALGVTSVLSEITILNMMNYSMPKVSYVKSSDKYLIGCFLFVFLTLVEYCAVLLLMKASEKQTKNDKDKIKEKEKEEAIQTVNGGHAISQELRAIKEVERARHSSADSDYYYFVFSQCSTSDFKETWRSKFFLLKNSLNEFIIKLWTNMLTESFIVGVDEYSFRGFPIAFAVFNGVYWWGFL